MVSRAAARFGALCNCLLDMLARCLQAGSVVSCGAVPRVAPTTARSMLTTPRAAYEGCQRIATATAARTASDGMQAQSGSPRPMPPRPRHECECVSRDVRRATRRARSPCRRPCG
jgi:hypothetical protein